MNPRLLFENTLLDMEKDAAAKEKETLKGSAAGKINRRPQYRRNDSNFFYQDEADAVETDAYFKPPAYRSPIKKDESVIKLPWLDHEDIEDADHQTSLEIENAILKSEKEEAIRSRDDLADSLQCAFARCDSLQLQLDRIHPDAFLDPDEKFAQLVEARIERDKAVQELYRSNVLNERIKTELKRMEGHNEALEQKIKTMEADLVGESSVEDRLSRHKKAVDVVCRGALQMMNRVRELAEGDGEARVTSTTVELPDEEWARVLMRPLEDEMEKIMSSFNKKRRVD